KLRALAVTTATRAEALPDVPTVGEFVPGYEATSPRGVGAPKNTSEHLDVSFQQVLIILIEPISKSPEEDNEAGELNKAQEILGTVLPPDEDSALPLDPGEEARGAFRFLRKKFFPGIWIGGRSLAIRGTWLSFGARSNANVVIFQSES